jgi:hypothetical protein
MTCDIWQLMRTARSNFRVYVVNCGMDLMLRGPDTPTCVPPLSASGQKRTSEFHVPKAARFRPAAQHA